MIEPQSGQHVIGQCDCGFFHDVSEIMSCRACDRFRDDKSMTTERCARELFDEFHEMAVRDHVSDEYLRQMCIGHAEQIPKIQELLQKHGKLK